MRDMTKCRTPYPDNRSITVCAPCMYAKDRAVVAQLLGVRNVRAVETVERCAVCGAGQESV